MRRRASCRRCRRPRASRSDRARPHPPGRAAGGDPSTARSAAGATRRDLPDPGGRARPRRGRTPPCLTPVAGIGLGVTMIWFSLLVLIPLTAILVQASEGGWAAYWQAVTSEQPAAALRLTVSQAFLVTLVNIVMGTAIAWVLVRDRFRGKQFLEVVI